MSKSVEELFKDAPEGATHWDASNFRINSFMKFDRGQWFYWPPASAEPHWCRWGANSKQDVEGMIERPQTKPKPWSGPEDGLPPVGTVCELRTKRGGWGEAEIKYQGRRGICVWLWVRRDGNSEQVEWAESPDKLEFRAIRTPAQIASEKRETAIRELMDVADVDCRVTAARLVDAGFKREVV